MKSVFKHGITVAALAVLVSAGSAKATPILGLSVEVSPTGQTGSYSSVLTTTPPSGSILFYEVVAQFAAPGTTNANTAKTPNGTSDSVIALPTFNLVSSSNSTFLMSALQNNFDTGSGHNSGTTGSGTLSGVRAIELGFTENADAPLTILTGTMSVGSSFTGITAGVVLPVTAAGSLRVGGTPVAVSASEATADPIIGYTNTALPEPASVGLLAIIAPALLGRRRRGA